MLRFTLVSSMIIVVLFSLGVYAGETDAASDRIQSQYQDRYLISLVTYDKVTNDKYRSIWQRVRRFDTSAARTMRDAARESCNASGGQLQEDFSCRR